MVKNCSNCSNKGVLCERNKKCYPAGHVKNLLTGDISGVIYRCVNWK